MNQIKAGDILLVEYKIDPLAWCVKALLRDSCNHIAIALNSNLIIENLSGGTYVKSIDKYRKSIYSVYIIRFNNISRITITQIITKLLSNVYKRDYLSFLINLFSTIFLRRSILTRGELCFNFIGKALCDAGRMQKQDFYVPNDFRQMNDITITKLS